MNHTFITPTQRLISWRNFRKSVFELSEYDQLSSVAKYWADVPLVMFSINWDRPNEWPSPWELIHEGNFDNTAIVYLMEQTLLLLGWGRNRLELKFINDKKNNDQFMILIIDNKYVLNYSINKVIELQKIKNNFLSLINFKFINNMYMEINNDNQ